MGKQIRRIAIGFFSAVTILLFVHFLLAEWIWPGRLMEYQTVPLESPTLPGRMDCSLPRRLPYREPVTMTCVYDPLSTGSEPVQLAVNVPPQQQQVTLRASGVGTGQSVLLRFSGTLPQTQQVQIAQTHTARGISFARQTLSVQALRSDGSALTGVVPIEAGLETADIAALRDLSKAGANIVGVLTALAALVGLGFQWREQERKRDQENQIKAMETLRAIQKGLIDLHTADANIQKIESKLEELYLLKSSLDSEHWNNIHYLLDLARCKTWQNPQRIAAIAHTGTDWPDAIAGALLHGVTVQSTEEDRRAVRDGLRAFDTEDCSFELQNAIYSKRKEIGVDPMQARQWPPAADKVPKRYPVGSQANPFPAARAEEDRGLFLIPQGNTPEQELFWRQHPVYQQRILNSQDSCAWVIAGEPGAGKTALAMALGQYHRGDLYTLTIQLQNNASLETLSHCLFAQLGAFLLYNPAFCLHLHRRLLFRLAAYWKVHLPNLLDQAEDLANRISTPQQRPTPALLEQRAQLDRLIIALKTVDPVFDPDPALDLLTHAAKVLGFTRVRIVLDADSAPFPDVTSILERLVTSSALAVPVQAIVFLPAQAAAGWRHGEVWSDATLCWQPEELESMFEHRLKAARSEEQVNIEAWRGLLDGAHTPREVVERWNARHGGGQ